MFLVIIKYLSLGAECIQTQPENIRGHPAIRAGFAWTLSKITPQIGLLLRSAREWALRAITYVDLNLQRIVPILTSFCDSSMFIVGYEQTSAAQKINAVSLPDECPLPKVTLIKFATAANSHFPAFKSKCAWCSDWTTSPVHHCH